MPFPLRRWFLVVVGCTLGLAVRAAEPPRLAVVIVVDQMRADYLERFAPFYGPDGFRRLTEGGTVFADCHYPYALTKTAPGHATIATGVFPAQHGIVGNEWIDHTTWAKVESVEDDTAALVGEVANPVRSPGGVLEAKSGRSPRRLLAPTLADRMKAEWGDVCRTVGVAKKDRSAILMVGQKPDGAYWLGQGRFVTSRYYRAALPKWVEDFNRVPRVEPAFGRVWDRVLPAAEYDRVQGPDDQPGEEPAHGLGRTFPRTIDGGGTTLGKDFYNAYDVSPFNSELVAEFAKAALHGEKLGTHARPDLLTVSFSQLDTCGHNYGPDSHEIMDSLIRLDRVLADLLAEFDRTVGAGRWVAVLTADHGVVPLPEVTRRRDPTATVGRLRGAELDAQVEAALTAKFGALPAGATWMARDGNGYHARTKALAAKKLTAEDVAPVVRAAVAAAPGIHAAFTRREVEAMPLDGDGLPAQVRRSYFAANCPEVTMVLAPGWADRTYLGTNHGTPWEYDTHVPLVWYGAGVPAAVRRERVGVHELVPTLARLLGLAPPAGAQGRALLAAP